MKKGISFCALLKLVVIILIVYLVGRSYSDVFFRLKIGGFRKWDIFAD
jgi:hypothetical protein